MKIIDYREGMKFNPELTRRAIESATTQLNKEFAGVEKLNSEVCLKRMSQILGLDINYDWPVDFSAEPAE